MLEYIGARKIMKSQDEAEISRDTLAHMVEEIRHAQIFKKMALKMDSSLETYGDSHLIAGDQGRNYLQAIDRGVEKLLGPGLKKTNYLVSTLIIEERANIIYPFYEKLLEPFGFGGLIRTILRDEEHHLEEIQGELKKCPEVTPEILVTLRKIEETAFWQIIEEIQSCLDSSVPMEASVEASTSLQARPV